MPTLVVVGKIIPVQHNGVVILLDISIHRTHWLLNITSTFQISNISQKWTVYPPRERSHIPPKGERQKILDSKVPTGMGYVIIPWRVISTLRHRFIHQCQGIPLTAKMQDLQTTKTWQMGPGFFRQVKLSLLYKNFG